MDRWMKVSCVTVLALAMAIAVGAQTAPATTTPLPLAPGAIASHPEWPKAKPDDVKSIDSIVAALYAVISGPPGKRDWDRFRSLFVPGGGRLAVTRVCHVMASPRTSCL